jgi:hypothetical protein
VNNLAIYGIGAYYEEDVTDLFLKKKVACVGWDKKDAPALHKIMSHIKTGDIIYIKKYPANEGLTIKAIGTVAEDKLIQVRGLGQACLKMKWVWVGEDYLGLIDDKYVVRLCTLYEEYNPMVQKKIIELMPSSLK